MMSVPDSNHAPHPNGNARLISMRCHLGEPGTRYDLHGHPFDEFTLVTDGPAVIVYPMGERPIRPDTLLLYRRGERHGARCDSRPSPRFWVVHFLPGPVLERALDRLVRLDPAERIWELSAESAAMFRWFFLQMFKERTQAASHYRLAESSWLRLLLVLVQRWAEGRNSTPEIPGAINSDTMRLWHLVNALAGKPEEFVRQAHQLPNYDSLRHGFKRAFGCSPREMLSVLRIQHAKNLLLETPLSIKEVSARLGFHRQHEFCRTFHRAVGLAPSEWRKNPLNAFHEPQK